MYLILIIIILYFFIKLFKSLKANMQMAFPFFIIFIIILLSFFEPTTKFIYKKINDIEENKEFKILSSYENQDLEKYIKKMSKENGFNVKFIYKGDLDIVDELNTNPENYDAVWISNSIWLYMLDDTYTISESKSISISPVVMGIKRDKADELNLIDREIYNKDLLNLIKEKKIKYIMSSVTQTNTGATAYLGFLNTLAGNPEVLTEEMLENKTLKNDMINIFSGVERVSGDEDYLEAMFLNDENYEAVIADESSLININKILKQQGKEELYLVYPKDGVAINDSTFAYIDNSKNKKGYFLKIQNYLLSDEGQELLQNLGRRTWYGGINYNTNKQIFNPNWGIDTTKYLITTKYPSKKVITKALNLYIEEFRKPTHVVFCLDYSGSMLGDGIDELVDAMEYILDYKQASLDNLQFSKKDKITIITFNTRVTNIWRVDNGKETEELINKIKKYKPNGSTALYDAIIEGLDILNKESDDYTKTVITMTDGEVNVGSFKKLQTKYNSLKKGIPVYSITFGSAIESQLEEIALLTNSKVFDGKTGLLQAFKEVRGYN